LQGDWSGTGRKFLSEKGWAGLSSGIGGDFEINGVHMFKNTFKTFSSPWEVVDENGNAGFIINPMAENEYSVTSEQNCSTI